FARTSFGGRERAPRQRQALLPFCRLDAGRAEQLQRLAQVAFEFDEIAIGQPRELARALRDQSHQLCELEAQAIVDDQATFSEKVRGAALDARPQRLATDTPAQLEWGTFRPFDDDRAVRSLKHREQLQTRRRVFEEHRIARDTQTLD